MKKVTRLRASSIAEVVISLTIISICFGIAMLSILGVNNSGVGFQEINDQTSVQNHIIEEMLSGKDLELVFESEFTDLEISKVNEAGLLLKSYVLRTNSGIIILDKLNYLPYESQ